MAHSSLAEFPPELVLTVASLLHPSAILSFSLTCKSIYGLSRASLERHRQLDKRYRTVNDAKSLSVPILLKKIQQDPALSWHVRRFVIFVDREDFEQNDGSSLEMYDPDVFIDDADKEEARAKILEETLLQNEDIPFYKDAVPTGVLEQAFYQPFPGSAVTESFDRLLASRAPLLSVEERSHWLAELEQRSQDWPLKALLLFSLPRLQTLIITANDNWSAPSLENISQYVRKISLSGMPRTLCPDWYNSIEVVRLNHWLENRHPHDQLDVTLHQIAALLTLPKIKAMYVGIGGYGDHNDYQYDSEPRSSSVEWLDIPMLEFANHDQFAGMMRSIKNLRGLNASRFFKARQGVEDVLDLWSNSLEVLQAHSLAAANPFRTFRNYVKLRRLAVDVTYFCSDTSQGYRRADFTERLPSAIEELRLHSGYGGSDVHPNELVRGLQELVQKKQSKEDFLSLRGICIRNFSSQDSGWHYTREVVTESGQTIVPTVTKRWRHPDYQAAIRSLKHLCNAADIVLSVCEAWDPYDENKPSVADMSPEERDQSGGYAGCPVCGHTQKIVIGEGIDRDDVYCNRAWF